MNPHSGSGRKFKTAVAIDCYNLEAWKYNIVLQLMTSENVILSSVLLLNGTQNKDVCSYSNKDPLIIRMLERLTSRENIKGKPYNELVDSCELLRVIPVSDLNSLSNVSDISTRDEVLKDLDAIIDLSDIALPGRLNINAVYGVWRIKPDYRLFDNGVCSDFWDLARGSQAVEMSLEKCGFSGDRPVDVCSTFETVLPFSQEINRNKAFWRASLLIPRVINGVINNGSSYLDKLTESSRAKTAISVTKRQATGITRKLKNLTDFLFVLSRQIHKKLFFGIEEEWQIMIDINKVDMPSYQFRRFKKLNPPEGLFWADPFAVYHEENYYLFVEEISFSEPNAHISVLELDGHGEVISGKRILEKPYHMSYPFVFTYDDKYYMIPETSGNKTIDIYKCMQFPDKWEFHKTIMTGISAVDTTLFEYNGKWWLFTSVDESEGNAGLDTDLFLYYSDNPLTGTWTGHPLNPVVSDVRSARPAGKIFIKDGRMFRPSQNCSGRYGRAININMIKILSETDYQEEVYKSIEPDWDNKLKGTHTINSDGFLTVIDAYKFRKRKIQK
jgi:hypothetical protein